MYVLETGNILSVNSESTKAIKVWALYENEAKVELELDTNSAVRAVPISRFRG